MTDIDTWLWPQVWERDVLEPEVWEAWGGNWDKEWSDPIKDIEYWKELMSNTPILVNTDSVTFRDCHFTGHNTHRVWLDETQPTTGEVRKTNKKNQDIYLEFKRRQDWRRLTFK
jgi:hypothetical protein